MMAPKANLLTTDEVAGVMKTAMEKPSGRPVVEPKWWTRLMAVVDDVTKRNDELRAELKQAQAAAAAASTSAAAAATGAGDAASRLEKENAELKKKLEAAETEALHAKASMKDLTEQLATANPSSRARRPISRPSSRTCSACPPRRPLCRPPRSTPRRSPRRRCARRR